MVGLDGTRHPAAISADGSVVAGNAANSEAFRWTEAGGIQGLGDLPGGEFHSRAGAMSSDGSIIVGSSISASGYEAYIWTESGGMVGLGALPGTDGNSFATGVSADGSVVVVGVSGFLTDPAQAAFIWDDANGMRNLRTLMEGFGLDLSGWALREAMAISEDGRTVVGWGTNPAGQREAWIAVLPSECRDSFDNDGDELIDFPNDPGCLDPESNVEDPQCQDGTNNDSGQDSLIDWDGGASAGLAPNLITQPDPQCLGKPWKNRERAGRCGLGAEVSGVLALVLWARRRVRGALRSVRA